MQIGDVVRWTSAWFGQYRTKTGIVVSIVPPGTTVEKALLSLPKYILKRHFDSGLYRSPVPRDVISYLVSVQTATARTQNAKRWLLWPKVELENLGPGRLLVLWQVLDKIEALEAHKVVIPSTPRELLHQQLDEWLDRQNVPPDVGLELHLAPSAELQSAWDLTHNPPLS